MENSQEIKKVEETLEEKQARYRKILAESAIKRSETMRKKVEDGTFVSWNRGKNMKELKGENYINPQKGKILSEETKEKMSLAKQNFVPWNAGKTMNELKGENYISPFKGKKHSEEAKEKMRLAKQNYVPWNVGKTMKTDDRIKSNSLKGQTKETSEVLKERSEHQSKVMKEKFTKQKNWNFGLTMDDFRVRDNVEKSTKTIQQQYDSGERVAWNKGKTMETDERVKPNVLKGQTKETSEIVRIKSEKQTETMQNLAEVGELNIWNKDKTSETDERIKQSAVKQSETNLRQFRNGERVVWNKDKTGLQDAWNIGKTKYDHPGMMAVSEARRKYMQNNPGTFISSQESLIKEYFFSLGLVENEDFIPQFYVEDIEDAYLADFYFPYLKTIVEIDGIYWHSQEGRPELDARRTEQLKKANYDVIRFTDKDVNERYDEVTKKLSELIFGGDDNVKSE